MATTRDEPKTTCSEVFRLYEKCAQTKHELALKKQELIYAPKGTKGAVTKWDIEQYENYMKANEDCRKLKKLLKIACETKTQT
jgi:hypothetical protein